MQKINILHLTNGLADSSITRIVLRLMEYLGQDEYTWHVGGLSDLGGMQEEFIQAGAHIIDFSKRRNYQNSIKEYVLTHQIRIIHTHSPRTILTVALSHTSGVFHLSTRHLLTSPSDRRWGIFYTLWDRFSLYMPNHIVAVSEAMYHKIISQPGMDNKRVTMIHNAIPVEQFYTPEKREDYKSELGLPHESLILGYAGRIEKVKRIDLLLLAFSNVLTRFPQARLIIAGEGDLICEMQEFASKLGISDKVVWLGFCRKIPKFLAASDIYIQTSINEGLSLSILEAMAAGKPVIATDVGGGNEVIKHKETGYLIQSGSVSAITNAIIDLIEHPDKRDELGKAARSHVNEEFNIYTMVDGYRLIYQKIA